MASEDTEFGKQWHLRRRVATWLCHHGGVDAEMARRVAKHFGFDASQVWTDAVRAMTESAGVMLFTAPKVRKFIVERDKSTCQYCGRWTATPHVDHVLPRNVGGHGKAYNLVVACPRCNLMRSYEVPLMLPRNLYAITIDDKDWRERIERFAEDWGTVIDKESRLADPVRGCYGHPTSEAY